MSRLLIALVAAAAVVPAVSVAQPAAEEEKGAAARCVEQGSSRSPIAINEPGVQRSAPIGASPSARRTDAREMTTGLDVEYRRADPSTKGAGAAGSAGGPPVCEHAINTKGTGTSGRGAASSVTFKATGTYSDGVMRRIPVRADQDSDGDGVLDEGELRITCSGGSVVDAVFTRRDSASGKYSAPINITPGTVTLRGSWDLKELKGARSAGGSQASVHVDLQSGDGVCPR